MSSSATTVGPTLGTREARRIVSLAVLYVALILISFIFITPILWMLTTALKPTQDIFKIPPVWIPNPPDWREFVDPWIEGGFNTYLFNTVKITVLSMIGTLLSTSLVGYSFARLRWPGRDLFFTLTLASMMLPFQVRIIPLFILFKQLGWLDTHLPLIVPSWFGDAFFIFLLRQYFRTLPIDLDDAAKIDGAGSFTIYWRILMPLVTPALATVAIFSFMDNWNAFFMATSFLVTLAPLAVFFFAQRYFIRGISMTGIKG
jgi:multiple sugar transport system permease protein